MATIGPSAPEERRLVRVERPATGGGVGRDDEGKVVFVRHALPGELVRVALTATSAHFSRGEAVEVLEASPERVAAPCPYAHPGGCGGCDLQHASASAQRDWKSALVREHLSRIAGVDLAPDVVAPPSAPRGSRTRLRCGVDGEGRLGLRGSRSHELVALERCWIADERFEEAFVRAWRGASEVELRALGEGAPFAVVRREGERSGLVEPRGLDGAVLDPSTRSRVAVGANVFTVGPRSFWQSHRDAPTMLTEAVLRLAAVAPGDDVVDLYSGVGLFSVPLARSVGPGGRVVAVESSPFAVRDARENAAGLGQLKIREWSVTPRAVNDTVRADSVVVLDPPRQGLAKGVAASVARRRPRRLVYVACDPATFARDLTIFLGSGFALKHLEVFDLFPMTEHVELVALLDTSEEKVDSAGETENLGSR
jgi:tRNA/tmRNA/rRNA uracil-C5-methylase (TrmA/RlmC/RlmD family)